VKYQVTGMTDNEAHYVLTHSGLQLFFIKNKNYLQI